ncbi:MAG: hypothetical protein QGI52_10815, partial [Alphaproteobacteria bacterium]|nr:hypothetical protein [Alphaproteobacteria bacterium]
MSELFPFRGALFGLPAELGVGGDDVIAPAGLVDGGMDESSHPLEFYIGRQADTGERAVCRQDVVP